MKMVDTSALEAEINKLIQVNAPNMDLEDWTLTVSIMGHEDMLFGRTYLHLTPPGQPPHVSLGLLVKANQNYQKENVE